MEIEVLRELIKSIDNQLSSHIDNTNKKLDVLIDIARQVATIQERQHRHSDDISRLESFILEVRKQQLSENEKLDTRITAIDTGHRTSTERIHARITEEAEKNALKDTLCKQDCSKKIKDAEAITEALNKDYLSKVNFIRGVLWLFSIVAVIGNGLLASYMLDIKNDISSSKAAISKIENRMNESDKQIDQVLQTVRKVMK